VIATKIDAAGDGARLRELQKYCKRHRYPCLPISAATREGLTELVNYVGQQVTQLRATACEISS
jgi:GTP-binding protein